MFKKSDIHISALDYVIDYDIGKKIATITPIVHATCIKTQILIASVHVDDHELRPSLKLVLEAGEGSYELPYVKIISPLIAAPGDDSSDKEYKMTLKLHFGDDEVYDLDKNIRIVKIDIKDSKI